MSILVQYLNFLRSSPGENKKNEKLAELPGYAPSVAGSMDTEKKDEGKLTSSITDHGLAAQETPKNINVASVKPVAMHSSSSAAAPAFTQPVTNPGRGRNVGVPSPQVQQQPTKIPRVLERIPKANSVTDPRSGTLLDKQGSLGYSRNTGISDTEGESYVNSSDVELLGKLGFEYSCEEYLGLEKTSEVLDVYSYIEKVAGIPKEVAKLIDSGQAFSGEYLKDMGYNVPKGYEVKGDLCCPVEKTEQSFQQTEKEKKESFEKTAAVDPAKTILITGHSGAGKSTLSKQLAEKLNLPLHRVDAQTSWDDLRAHFEKNPELERKALTPGTAENKQYIKDVRKIVHRSLKEINGPAVLEGTQLTTLPAKQLAKYKANILVGGDMNQSIAQRLQRMTDKAAKKGITLSPEQLAKKREESQLVADSWYPGMEKFRKLPGVLSYNHSEHQIDPLVEQLKHLMGKQASEKPGLWANIHAKRKRGEKAAADPTQTVNKERLIHMYAANDPDMRILSQGPVTEKDFLYHASGKKFDILDPKYNSKKSYGYEYTEPVVFAGDAASSAFAANPTEEYQSVKDKIKESVYHRLIDELTGRKALLGHTPGGYLYKLPASEFTRIEREDNELGKWNKSTEYISHRPVKPVSVTPIQSTDVDAIPEYEYLGKDFVGEMPARHYLKQAKNPKVIAAVNAWLANNQEKADKEKTASEEDYVFTHYNPHGKHKELRPLTYLELLKNRSRGRWENKPEMAQKYVDDRKEFEATLGKELLEAGLPYDSEKSFLYGAVDGHERFGQPGAYQHLANMPDLDKTFFTINGLDDKDHIGRGKQGLLNSIKLWKENQDKLKDTEYMGMTIRPRVEIMTQEGVTPHTIKRLKEKTASESKPGLWANIHAKRKRGEKAAKPGDEDYPDREQWNKLSKESEAMVISGIHGDEPAGNAAAKKLEDKAEVVSHVNPSNKRSLDGKDLNRHFDKPTETARHKKLLKLIERKKPSKVVSLHEDDEVDKPYAYSSESMAEKVKKALKGKDTADSAHGDKTEKGVIVKGKNPPSGSLEKALERRNIDHATIETPSKKEDLGSRVKTHTDVVEKLLGKKGAADPGQSILITGHSGAGKTTLSQTLAEKLGLPLQRVDAHPEFKEYVTKDDHGRWQKSLTPGTKEYDFYTDLVHRANKHTIDNSPPASIIEGSQLGHMTPEELAKYRAHILVGGDPEQSIAQRIARSAKKKGVTFSPEEILEKQMKARAVVDFWEPGIEKFRKLPGILQYNHTEHQLEPLIARLQKILTKKANVANTAPTMSGGNLNNPPQGTVINNNGYLPPAAEEKEPERQYNTPYNQPTVESPYLNITKDLASSLAQGASVALSTSMHPISGRNVPNLVRNWGYGNSLNLSKGLGLAGNLLSGVGIVSNAQDANERWNKGDRIGARISGAGTVGAIAQLMPERRTKIVGSILNVGSTAANATRDIYRYKNRPVEFRNNPAILGNPSDNSSGNPAQIKEGAASPAWQRSAGKNPEGGLNAKGRASYKKQTGGTLKAPVTESNPKGDRAKRQNSFCSRMCGMKSKNTGSAAQSNPDSRINKSLRKWNCKCGKDHSSMFEKLACAVKTADLTNTQPTVTTQGNLPILNPNHGAINMPNQVLAQQNPPSISELSDGAIDPYDVLPYVTSKITKHVKPSVPKSLQPKLHRFNTVANIVGPANSYADNPEDTIGNTINLVGAYGGIASLSDNPFIARAGDVVNNGAMAANIGRKIYNNREKYSGPPIMPTDPTPSLLDPRQAQPFSGPNSVPEFQNNLTRVNPRPVENNSNPAFQNDLKRIGTSPVENNTYIAGTNSVNKKAEATYPLKSSNIRAVGYDKKDKALDVAFHSGSEYRYSDVPKSLFDRIKRVKSPGKFFNKHIKHKDYIYEKIAGMPEHIRKAIATGDKTLLQAAQSRSVASRVANAAAKKRKLEIAKLLGAEEPVLLARGEEFQKHFPFSVSHEFEQAKKLVDPSYRPDLSKYLGKLES